MMKICDITNIGTFRYVVPIFFIFQMVCMPQVVEVEGSFAVISRKYSTVSL